MCTCYASSLLTSLSLASQTREGVETRSVSGTHVPAHDDTMYFRTLPSLPVLACARVNPSKVRASESPRPM